MIDAQIVDKSRQLHSWFLKNRYTLAIAESCTGGNISAAIVENAGSSEYYLGGVTSYSNSCKQNVLGVSAQTLDESGAVSEKTAIQMAHGVMKLLGADYAVATTGITGPAGGSTEKPVGMVWMAACSHTQTITFCLNDGDTGRNDNCRRAVLKALDLLIMITMQ